VRDQLRVGRMVGRLDADDLRREGVIVLLEMAEEVELGLGGTNQEQLPMTGERSRDLPKVAVLVVGVVPDAQIDFVGVTVEVRAGRIDDRLADLVVVDLEDPSFFVIDPDDCVLHDELLERGWGLKWFVCGRAGSSPPRLSKKKAMATGGDPQGDANILRPMVPPAQKVALRGHACRSSTELRLTGRVNVKQVRPGRDSTAIVPWWSATIRWTSESPRPVP